MHHSFVNYGDAWPSRRESLRARRDAGQGRVEEELWHLSADIRMCIRLKLGIIHLQIVGKVGLLQPTMNSKMQTWRPLIDCDCDRCT